MPTCVRCCACRRELPLACAVAGVCCVHGFLGCARCRSWQPHTGARCPTRIPCRQGVGGRCHRWTLCVGGHWGGAGACCSACVPGRFPRSHPCPVKCIPAGEAYPGAHPHFLEPCCCAHPCCCAVPPSLSKGALRALNVCSTSQNCKHASWWNLQFSEAWKLSEVVGCIVKTFHRSLACTPAAPALWPEPGDEAAGRDPPASCLCPAEAGRDCAHCASPSPCSGRFSCWWVGFGEVQVFFILVLILLMSCKSFICCALEVFVIICLAGEPAE